jgi:hypothetical protein
MEPKDSSTCSQEPIASPYLSHLSPIHTLKTQCLKIHLNIIPCVRLRFQSGIFVLSFLTNILISLNILHYPTSIKKEHEQKEKFPLPC